MEFADFARAHGLIINSVIPGKWVRVPTIDHPKKRNGAYKYLGDIGFVQNHATQVDVSIWKPERQDDYKVDYKAIAAQARRHEAGRRALQAKAAKKAQWIIGQCGTREHQYLTDKGFPEAKGLVWTNDDEPILVVPMRVGTLVVGCQLITNSGDKKFLSGQRTNDAVFHIGSGTPVLCEGYATALSIHSALSAIKARRSVVACFSAHNLTRVAKTVPDAIVVADNDVSLTGERVAKETGLPYWISDVVGEDFNDYAKRVGRFAASQSLRKLLISN